MAKELFEKYREEEIHTLISLPYGDYKRHIDICKHQGVEPRVEFIKHFIPEMREEFKKDKRWSDLEKTIKECRAEQREIESEIRVNGETSS